MNHDLTWSCHICGDERPDEFISVWKKPVKGAKIPMTQNIRYCNDRTSCSLGVADFELVDLSGDDDE